MLTFKKFFLWAMILAIPTSQAQTSTPTQIDSYRDVIIYPYHAAPYYSYPYTTGYGYRYSLPAVNAEYHHPHNDREIVTYPDGPYHYHNYYRVGNTVCYQIAHRVICEY